MFCLIRIAKTRLCKVTKTGYYYYAPSIQHQLIFPERVNLRVNIKRLYEVPCNLSTSEKQSWVEVSVFRRDRGLILGVFLLTSNWTLFWNKITDLLCCRPKACSKGKQKLSHDRPVIPLPITAVGCHHHSPFHTEVNLGRTKIEASKAIGHFMSSFFWIGYFSWSIKNYMASHLNLCINGTC